MEPVNEPSLEHLGERTVTILSCMERLACSRRPFFLAVLAFPLFEILKHRLAPSKIIVLIPNDVLEQHIPLLEKIGFLGLGTDRKLFRLQHLFVKLKLLLVELSLFAKPLYHALGIGKPEAVGFQEKLIV
jgi:hypothetical protein